MLKLCLNDKFDKNVTKISSTKQLLLIIYYFEVKVEITLTLYFFI